VPIVADCGAVTEVIDEGVDGFVVPQSLVVEGFIAHVLQLKEYGALRREMQLAAMEKGVARDWREGALAFAGKIEELREAQARRQARLTLAG